MTKNLARLMWVLIMVIHIIACNSNDGMKKSQVNKKADVLKKINDQRKAEKEARAWPLDMSKCKPLQIGEPKSVNLFLIPIPEEDLEIDERGYLDSTSATHGIYYENMLAALDAYATTYVKSEMGNQIASGELQIRFTDHPGTAAFGVAAKTGTDGKSKEGFQAYILINMYFMEAVINEGGGEIAVGLVTALLHEYDHYNDFKKVPESEIEKWRVFILDGTPFAISTSERNTEVFCNDYWTTEESAYYNTALALADLGIAHEITTCAGDRKQFRHYFFEKIAFTPDMYLNRQPKCAQIWAELSGHPNPKTWAK